MSNWNRDYLEDNKYNVNPNSYIKLSVLFQTASFEKIYIELYRKIWSLFNNSMNNIGHMLSYAIDAYNTYYISFTGDAFINILVRYHCKIFFGYHILLFLMIMVSYFN